MNPILITGLYEKTDATHGEGLGKYIRDEWRKHYALEIITSVYDRDAIKLIPETGPVPALGGFSWGFSKVVQICRILTAQGRTIPFVFSIDGVPNHDLLPDIAWPTKPNFAGFDLPDGVLKAACWWRGYDNQKSIFSGPIRSGKCPFVNTKYNPRPGHSEAEQHGEYCLHPSAAVVAAAVKAAMA